MTITISPKGPHFTVSSSQAGNPAIAGLADGDFVLVWPDGAASFNVAAQLFHGNGLVGPAFLPALFSGTSDNLIDENVAALANGNFIVAWVDSLIQNGNTRSTVHAQIYQPNLTRVGGPITVMPQFPGPVSGAAVSPLSNGGFVVALSAILGRAGISPEVGDFNHDGRSDILWQNDSGEVVIWALNGASVTGGSSLGNPGPSWHVKGNGDFNGDGFSDILWQNDSDEAAVWEMNGTSVIGGGSLGNPGPSWYVMGTGDYNRDPRADILFQNGSGKSLGNERNGRDRRRQSRQPRPDLAHLIGRSR